MGNIKTLSINNTFVNRTYKKYLIPAILAMLGGTVNVLFDGILVGQKLGENGLSAVSLAMPVYLILCTIGAVIAGGGFVLSSRALGKDEGKKANDYFVTTFWVMAIVSIIATAVGSFVALPIARLLSGGGELESLVYAYLLVTLLGASVKIMVYLPAFYLRIMGKQKVASGALLAMTAVNIVLDVFFLFVLDMGIEGAALASVIASLVAVVIGFVPLLKKSSQFKIKKSVKFSLTGEIFTSGTPMGANNLASALRVLILNAILLSFGGSTYVSIFAVVNSICEFSICIVSGVPQGASGLIGVFNGEKNVAGVKELFRLQIKYGMTMMLPFVLVVVLASSQIGWLFGVSSLPLFFPIFCLGISLFFALVNNIFATHYNMIGRIALSNGITFLRVLICSVLFLLLLFAIDSRLIWIFLPLSEISTYIMFVVVARRIVKKHKEYDGVMLLDYSYESSGNVLDFSVSPNEVSICDASADIAEFWEICEVPAKTGIKISLAIEEIMMMYLSAPKGKEALESFDVRIFKFEGGIGVRIRCGGGLIDPFTVEDDEIDTFGIKIIESIAEVAEYRNLLGFNNVLVLV